jgi:GT2 family glycosyltransferase
MMRQAVRPHVGAVGAKLLYADRSIQHAGVIVGLGDAAGHAHRYLPNDKPGYFNHAHLPQYVSAVTAACLVVEKKKFLEVGGLDETHLAIAFNDADLCLKLGAAGWRNLYTPHAVLIHHESKSRRRDAMASEQSRYRSELRTLQTRWRTIGFRDPCHHPNLSRASETFQIDFRQAGSA